MKKLINIILKSKMTQLFFDTFFFVNDSVIMGRMEYVFTLRKIETYKFTHFVLFYYINACKS